MGQGLLNNLRDGVRDVMGSFTAEALWVAFGPDVGLRSCPSDSFTKVPWSFGLANAASAAAKKGKVADVTNSVSWAVGKRAIHSFSYPCNLCW